MKFKQLTLDEYKEKTVLQPTPSSFEWHNFIIAIGFWFCLKYLIGGWIGFAIGAISYFIIHICLSTMDKIAHR